MKVAIVGGGFLGIMMAKSLKEESIDFVCFEKSSEVGGTWRFRKNVQYGVASTTSTTIMINSKELGSISDDPWPDECPTFPKHSVVLKKILSYAEKHDILRHILCNKEVVHVKRAELYDVTGQWMVSVKDSKSGEVTSEVYDGVMLCTGHFAHPVMPSYPGSSEFRGRILHSHSLRTFESFTDKNVVVVGFGTSALDAAVEISRIAKQVYLSSRSQTWVLPRLSNHGLPTDFLYFRRCLFALKSLLNIKVMSWFGQKQVDHAKFQHDLYGIYPSCPALAGEPVFNDDLAMKLASGAIILRKNIQQFSTNSVVFEGDVSQTPVDAMIMATGYKHDFSFLEDGILSEEDGKISLYKCMYPPHLKFASLAFIGFLLSWGPGVVVGELQTRWAAYILSGKGSLPDGNIMTKEIEERYESNRRRYRALDKMSQRVDVIDYSDDIASEIGAKPNFWRMAFKDPRLYIACIFGPFLPYQYRLEGPHNWPGARDSIFTVFYRMKKGLSPGNTFEGRVLSFQSLFHIFGLSLVYIFLMIV